MRLEELTAGATVRGLQPDGPVDVIAVTPYGDEAIEVVFRDAGGVPDTRVVYRADEESLELVAASAARPFDAAGDIYRLTAEAHRIKTAGEYDEMLALTSSEVEPLPHQITAVYGDLLPRTPLRFLLADDPGAGKTIMAGLFIKELMLRGDLERCIVVAPGGLVAQWKEELDEKFQLAATIVTSALLEESTMSELADRHPLLIARMDHIARNEDHRDEIAQVSWDLVVVDEAHRMAARYYGNELDKTRRYQLGELLRDATRHYLLMTATPHSGKPDDFQAFLALLDPDRFAGKASRLGERVTDTTGVMRRMIKEDIRRVDGTPLFPERIAQTVPYELSPLEADLYSAVTDYVSEEMGRAEALSGQRGRTVGFALTVLQRRLASSPEAILRSLQRRRKRLEGLRQDMLAGVVPNKPTDEEVLAARLATKADEDADFDAETTEQVEDAVADAATSARTVAELEKEIVILADLERRALAVHASGEDRKWSELASIIDERALAADRDGNPRKLIIFTEHRDTLRYLASRIRNRLGDNDAVVEIDGSTPRRERERRTTEFRSNPRVRILVGTDAAGEGLNLQRAHLMVNYDLPWNPNRIEQRFGRIHRIGQEEICRLWNLVASNTREGAVYERLLEKLEEQRRQLGGKVFDVLGEAFEETPLRDLLLRAIRHAEGSAERVEVDRQIDDAMTKNMPALLREHALAKEVLTDEELRGIRRRMDEARARRLQPHYLEMFFRFAFSKLGGRLARREKGRFEIATVPLDLRRPTLQPTRGAVASRYERVTFDPGLAKLPHAVHAQVLAPGHPLFDATLRATLERNFDVLSRGAILLDRHAADDAAPRLIVAIALTIQNGAKTTIAKRFVYASVDATGQVTDAGQAPYLDFEPLPPEASLDVSAYDWLGEAERAARAWVIHERLASDLEAERRRVTTEVERTRIAVETRLNGEINRLNAAASEASDNEAAGRPVRVRPATLIAQADALEQRQQARLQELALEKQLAAGSPQVVSAVLVVPPSALTMAGGAPPPPRHAKETAEVERRAVDAVLAAERALGRDPLELDHNHPGWDITSTAPDGHVTLIEVKGRLAGADDFFVTYTEILTGKNADRYRLALVRVSPDGPEHDEVRYVEDPFARTELGDLSATGVRVHWNKTWVTGRAPF